MTASFGSSVVLRMRPEGGLRRYFEMTTGVPRRTSGFSSRSARCDTHRHPAETDLPIDDGRFVPWIASWSPPLHPDGRCGWIPDSPNANDPYELERGNAMRSVTK